MSKTRKTNSEGDFLRATLIKERVTLNNKPNLSELINLPNEHYRNFN